ncbi:hypothetical protein [Pseudomonas sp.]|jgi:hypothetical protein|uniref:hypothetical protein n=1 Tax=Pseudomonas sp. TaxID=306 RepID=UPI002EDB5A8A
MSQPTRKPIYVRRDIAIAILTVVALWASAWLVWYWSVRTEPVFEFRSIAMQDLQGSKADSFHVGEVAVVRREVCLKREIGIRFSPALRNAEGVLFPLNGMTVEKAKGCNTLYYGFVVPDLPPGKYTYVNAATYQANVIGRDEFITFPSMTLQILPK